MILFTELGKDRDEGFKIGGKKEIKKFYFGQENLR